MLRSRLLCSSLACWCAPALAASFRSSTSRARSIMPRIFLAIGALLIGYGLALDSALDWIGTLPYALRLFFSFALIFPPAFLMGFPMPIAMTLLARLGKDHMFLWAWGINGC